MIYIQIVIYSYIDMYLMYIYIISIIISIGINIINNSMVIYKVYVFRCLDGWGFGLEQGLWIGLEIE